MKRDPAFEIDVTMAAKLSETLHATTIALSACAAAVTALNGRVHALEIAVGDLGKHVGTVDSQSSEGRNQ